VKKSLAAVLLVLFVLLLVPFSHAAEECTTVVVAGRATVDGRPLLWKNRDTDDVHNEVAYLTGGVYSLVAVINANSTTSTWMGTNSAGLAIENSVSSDLEGTSSSQNGSFMKFALQYCATVAEFEQLLLDTNAAGRQTQANYGVIDATGAAAIFETGNHTFAKYDAADSAIAPLGYVVRTNFAFTGDGSGTGYERYNRAVELVEEGIGAGVMSHEYLLRHLARDLRNDLVDPYPLPYEGTQEGHPAGYTRTNYSINRYRTRSCAVFHGVLPDEDPLLTTMWVVLGEPACGIALPLWVHAAAVPPEMNGTSTAPLSDAVLANKAECYTDTSGLPYASQYLDTYALDDGLGGGILGFSLPIEDRAFSRARTALEGWRETFPTAAAAAAFERELARDSYCLYLTSTAPTDIPAPRNLAVRRVLNRSLFLSEQIDLLSWDPVEAPGGVSGYRVYEFAGGVKTLLGTVGSAPTEFRRRGLRAVDTFLYVVAAVDGGGGEGDPACVTSAGSGQADPSAQERRATAVQTVSKFLRLPLRLGVRF
jgi:hypothetical protein